MEADEDDETLKTRSISDCYDYDAAIVIELPACEAPREGRSRYA
jgi:hypothetical protein